MEAKDTMLKCSKCKRKFKMPMDFKGIITCEDCDSFMNQRDELLEASKALINHMGKDWESNPLLTLFYRNKLKAIAKAIKNCK